MSMPMLLLQIFQQTAPTAPIVDAAMGRAEIGFYMGLAGLAGAILKSIIDWLFTRSKTKAEIEFSNSGARKNDNEVIVQLHGKLFEAQRLLAETQENLDKWIRRFETGVEDSTEIEEELRRARRACEDCLEGRRGYYDVCKLIQNLFLRLEPLIAQLQLGELERDSFLMEIKRYRDTIANLTRDYDDEANKKIRN